MTRPSYLYLFFLLSFLTSRAYSADFTLINGQTKASIVYDPKGPALDSISAYLLQKDIQRVTNILPEVLTDAAKAKGNVIFIGNISSTLIRNILGKNNSSFSSGLSGKWECYGLKVVNKPNAGIGQALIIAGSDTRGTAFGVFSISEKIGISPWYWWADVPVAPKKTLIVTVNDFISATPSVKYRGIFLNDEDWGLQPWAAKTFEPETGDIGPKTYAKIFELLLRLKANLIWPAMHPSTKAFFHYPGNEKTAADYAIMIGSSHAEPMLRNNVDEWTKDMGSFNYITNKNKVLSYWEKRVKESKNINAIYSLGMRGVHDSGMEGVKGAKEAVPLLEQIFSDQRTLLKENINPDILQVPQVFTAYKEVLDIYDSDLKLPADVTLVWPDDNYGYISRLNTQAELARPGGSGVYYHASYWGRPHDYLWLSSTHPGLIREEMMKAFETKSDRLWVLNVGDLKPLEYNIQFFLDMAYNAGPFKNSEYTKKHLHDWAGNIFGKANAGQIAGLLWKYYNLAFERKPEFMGWSQTEPTTKTTYTSYNHFYYGDEAQRRIDSYTQLELEVKALRKQIKPADADAFYQLVYYPVTGAALMNKKFLYRDKSYLYARQNRLSALDYATMSEKAYQDIVKETAFYNDQLAGGKWKNMMSMTPRGLPVYQQPVLPEIKIDRPGMWGLAPEGFVKKDSSLLSKNPSELVLPVFNKAINSKYFIDIFLSEEKTIDWAVSSKDSWITVSRRTGTLSPQPGKNQTRIWVGIDWGKAGKDAATGTLAFNAGGKTIIVKVNVSNPDLPQGFKGGIEDNGYISLLAGSYSRKTAKGSAEWKTVSGLGNIEKSLTAFPFNLKLPLLNNPQALKESAPYVEYDFYTYSEGIPKVAVYTLPTHPVNTGYSMRYAVSIDKGPVKILDFKTVGRSEEWKQNVLRNSAVREFTGQTIKKGKHTLQVYMVDPGVVLQNITIDMGGLKEAYSVIPETKN
jgi:hypothetical protein